MKDSLPTYIFTRFAMTNGLQPKIIAAAVFATNPARLVCKFATATLMRKWLDMMGYALYSSEADYQTWFRVKPFKCDGCSNRFEHDKVFAKFIGHQENTYCQSCIMYPYNGIGE